MAKDFDSIRVRDLGLRLERSRFAPLLRRLRRELAAKGVGLRPNFYLSNEFGCVVRTCNIGLLWVDALDQIPALARRYRDRMRSPEILMRILRHESGHAFGYVHRLYRRPDFRRLFEVRGDFFRTYPDGGWRPSRRDEERLKRREHINIRCLKHPDEDFAISFQTWLNPDIDWRRDYAEAPAILRKLEFVDAAVRKLGRKPYRNDPHDIDVPIREIRSTVAEWFGEGSPG